MGGRHRRDPGAAPSYPVIVGAGFRVAKLYQMLPVSVSGDPGARTPRTTRRCGTCSWPDKKVKLVLAYPMTTGRNLDEVPLVIDSRHLTARHRVAAPVNRQQGQDVLIAGSVCDEQDRDLYPDGSTAPPPRGLREARGGPNRWRPDPVSLTRGGTLCHHEPPRCTELTCTTRRSSSSTPRRSVTTVTWRTTGRSPPSSTRSAIPTGYWPWWPEGKAARTRPPALEPLARTLPYDPAVTAGGVPAAELGKITALVLILGGSNSPARFRRSVAEQAAATPGAADDAGRI